MRFEPGSRLCDAEEMYRSTYNVAQLQQRNLAANINAVDELRIQSLLKVHHTIDTTLRSVHIVRLKFRQYFSCCDVAVVVAN